MTDVVIASAARTAIGSYGRGLASVPPSELGAIAARAAIERAGIEPDQVDHVVFGNVIHTEPADAYMARVVGIKAGRPEEVPAYTVNRLCGTGVQAIVSAAQAIQTGEARVALAGGAESMSRGPYWMPSARWGARMGEAELVDPVMGALTDPFNVDPDGRHRREPGRARVDLPRAPGRVRGRARTSEPRPRARRGPLRRPDRARAGRGQARDGRLHARRAHPRGRLGGVDGQAQAGVQARRHGHRRQRLGDERRRRRASC